jgi:hypothetical protein
MASSRFNPSIQQVRTDGSARRGGGRRRVPRRADPSRFAVIKTSFQVGARRLLEQERPHPCALELPILRRIKVNHGE